MFFKSKSAKMFVFATFHRQNVADGDRQNNSFIEDQKPEIKSRRGMCRHEGVPVLNQKWQLLLKAGASNE